MRDVLHVGMESSIEAEGKNDCKRMFLGLFWSSVAL